MYKLSFVLMVVLILVVACTSQPASTPTLVTTPVPATSVPTTTPLPAAAAYEVEVTKDVEYTTPLQQDVPVQTLDVYAPTLPGSWPVVVLLHGYANSKNVAAYTSLAKDLAGRGAVVFVPSWSAYTSLESTKNDGQLVREASEELTCVVYFVRARAADYRGDPERVTLIGHSEAAGMRKALVGDDSQLWEAFASSRGGPPPQVDCLVSGVSADVDAFVGLGVEYTAAESLKENDPELWQLCSPYAAIGQNQSLLVHLVHAEQDHWIPLEESVEFHRVLVDAGYDATLTTIEGEEHGVPFSGPGREALIQAIMAAARR